MATCIEQRGRNSWRVTVSAGYKENKQKRIHRTFRFPAEWSQEKQEKEVEKKAALLYAEFSNNQIMPGKDMLFSEFSELWLKEYAKVNLEAKNYYGAQSRLKLYILPFFDKMRLSQIRTLTITKFVNHMSNQVNPKTGKRLAPRTVINYLTELSCIFTTAIKWEMISSNPCSNISKPKVEDPEVIILDEDESAYLLKMLEFEKTSYSCLVYIGIMTGFRLGEIIALKWSDIDFDSNQISITRARTYVPKVGSFDKCPKTKTSKRVISVPQILISKLKILQDEQKVQQIRLGSKWQDYDYLFTGFDGSPTGHNTPSRWFKNYIIKLRQIQYKEQIEAKVPKSKIKLIPMIHFHSLRHNHASILLSEGVDLQTVSSRLGHSKTSITANIYCHSVKGKDKQASSVIERYLRSAEITEL